MTSLSLHAHRRALIARARCPGCAEILRGKSLYGGAPCSYCNTPTDLFGVSGTLAAHSFRKKAWIQLSILAVLVAASYLILGWIPLLGAVALLAAGFWIKIGILYPITRTFSLKRRVVTRFSAKMMLTTFIILSIILCEAMTLTGVLSGFLKAFIGGLQVFIAAMLVTFYVNWQIGREQRNAPVSILEWGALFGFTGTVGVASAALIFILAGLGFAFEWVMREITPYLV